jgi:pimeloyl-ACP methyl ester carboxylesterase
MTDRTGPFTSNFATIDGQRIHYIDEGKGPLVLLVHGWPDFWRCWVPQIQPLVDAGYRAVAVDLRGYGRSGKPTEIEAYRIDRVIADLEGLVHRLGEARCTVVGHDWGSIIAWTAGLTRPRTFYQVVGVSVPYGGRALLPLAGASNFGERRPREAQRIMAGSDDVWFYQEYFAIPGRLERAVEPDIASFCRSMRWAASGNAQKDVPALPPPADLSVSEIQNRTRAARYCMPRDSDAGYASAAVPDDLPEWMSDIGLYIAEYERTGITGPTNYYRAMESSWEVLEPFADVPLTSRSMFVAGERDMPYHWGKEAIEEYGVRAPGLERIEVIPDVGHWINRESADSFNRTLVSFLDSR